MDDTEDDARYPLNPHPQNPRHHQHHHRFSSSARRKPFHRNPTLPPPVPPRRYSYDDDDEEEDDEDERMNQQPMDEDDDDEEDDEDGGGHRVFRRVGAYGGGDDDDGSSVESRGKRRRLDRFEFAPRVPPPVSSKPLARPSQIDWSEESTFVLLDAWGDRYLQNGRKSLRSEEWSKVAKRVSQASKASRSDAQCRNRLDTLKKKYKKEKAKLAEHPNSSSKWVYFHKLDTLMSSPSRLPPAGSGGQQQTPRLPCGVDAGDYVFASSSLYLNRVNGNDEMRDSPGDTGTEDDGKDGNESDGLPPIRENSSRSSDSSYRILADSIQKFGEIYEKMENTKRQQMVELERMRKELQRDLEVQKRQILERAQAEIAKIREEGGFDDDEEDKVDDDEDDDDGDDNGGSAENLSG